MIISTGMGSDNEIAEAVQTARDGGCTEIVLLHCISGYPTPVEATNLGRIAVLREKYGTMIGLSDHTRGVSVPVAAIALGATVIEKHFTMSHDDGGLDAAFSLDVAEFTELTTSARQIYKAIAGDKSAAEDAQKLTRALRRSLYVVADIPAGAPIQESNIRSVRPANGLAPRHYAEVLGRRAARDLAAGEPLQWDMLA